jgi:hypothetical protein
MELERRREMKSLPARDELPQTLFVARTFAGEATSR